MIPTHRATLTVLLTLLLAVAWLGLVATGFALWEIDEAKPGTPGTPVASEARSPADRGWELTFFAHPHCPCTRAGLAELAELKREAGPSLSVRVVFIRPRGVPAGWEKAASWSVAQSSGAEVIADEGGAEARRAGATTSGTAVLRDDVGRVAFRGGITRGRGRVGESAGRRAILDNFANGRLAATETPVFGCPLFGPDETTDTEEGAQCRN